MNNRETFRTSRTRGGMATVRVAPAHEDGAGVEMTVQAGGQTDRVYFRSDDIGLLPLVDAALPACFLACMFSAWDLEVEGPVSQRLLEAMPKVGDIYHAWYPEATGIAIRNPMGVTRPPAKNKRVGLFFSGGIDSSYSLLQHLQEITDLIFVHGFEARAEDEPAYQMVAEKLRSAGRQLGKSVIFVESNLRSYLRSFKLRWDQHANGPALAAVGHLLGSHFARIYIAGSSSYDQLQPKSAHPLLDPLWSSESLEFVHDGCEANRLEKTLSVADDERALTWLRPCSNSTVNHYNCGRCTKCVMAMINLMAAGALERCTTLPHKVGVWRIITAPFLSETSRLRVRETLAMLAGKPQFRSVAVALRVADLRGTLVRRLRARVTGRFPAVRAGIRVVRRLLGRGSPRGAAAEQDTWAAA